jgi:hypothetical protein
MLGSYKRLESGVVFVEAIPKTPSGKKLRRTLKEWATKELGRSTKLLTLDLDMESSAAIRELNGNLKHRARFSYGHLGWVAVSFVRPCPFS